MQIGNFLPGLERYLSNKHFHCSYFSKTCWDDVHQRKLIPPMVPLVSGEEDTRYFNFYQENNINMSETVREDDLKLFKEF